MTKIREANGPATAQAPENETLGDLAEALVEVKDEQESIKESLEAAHERLEKLEALVLTAEAPDESKPSEESAEGAADAEAPASAKAGKKGK